MGELKLSAFHGGSHVSGLCPLEPGTNALTGQKGRDNGSVCCHSDQVFSEFLPGRGRDGILGTALTASAQWAPPACGQGLCWDHPSVGLSICILWLLSRGVCPSASCSPGFPVLGAPPSGVAPNSCGLHGALQLPNRTALPTEGASLQVHGCASCKPSLPPPAALITPGGIGS